MRTSVYNRFTSMPIVERHVQALWYDRALRPSVLRTRRGQLLKVISPGEWNPGPGPDFHDAVLELQPSGKRLRGDVEIHLSPNDWERHGHGHDSAYRKVVAHVTWFCGPTPATLPAGAVSIWLGRFFLGDPGFSPERIDLEAYPYARLPLEGRPCARLLAGNPDLAREVLSAAGACRLHYKARRYATDSRLRGYKRAQFYYEEVMNALGYSRNSGCFREIAQRVPLEVVRSEPMNALTAYMVAAEFCEWDRRCIRPDNDPSRRLAAAAALFTQTKIIETLAWRDFTKAGCRDLIRMLSADGLVGRGRSAAVIANVIVPFAIADGRLDMPPDWLPPEDIPECVRLTAFRLFGRDHNPVVLYADDGLRIQGLIQIYRDCCLKIHPDCQDCELARGLAKPLESD